MVPSIEHTRWLVIVQKQHDPPGLRCTHGWACDVWACHVDGAVPRSVAAVSECDDRCKMGLQMWACMACVNGRSHQTCDCLQMLLTLNASLVCRIQSPQLQAQLPTQQRRSSSCSCCWRVSPRMTCFAGGMMEAFRLLLLIDCMLLLRSSMHPKVCKLLKGW